MVEVNDRNFFEWKDNVESVIAQSSFVAIDFEFSGLGSNFNRLFDSLEERYLKLVECVRQNRPLQLGFACYKEVEDGRFAVDCFSILLLKKESEERISFSTGASKFLLQNHFDFNKLFLDGLSYCTENEAMVWKRRIQRGPEFYSYFGENIVDKVRLLVMRVDNHVRKINKADEEVDKNEDLLEEEKFGESLSLSIETSFPIAPDLDSSNDEDVVSEYLWKSHLSLIESQFVLLRLTEAFPNICFSFDKSLVTIQMCPRDQSMPNHRKAMKQCEKRLLESIKGASCFVDMITKMGIPLVGHNSLLDLMFLHNYFISSLPDSYGLFKASLKDKFPLIIDTKILACEVQETLYKNGAADLSLEALGNFIDSKECRRLVPHKSEDTISGDYLSEAFANDDYHFHDAAFDALITGDVFVRLSHIYANTLHDKTELKFRSLQKLLQYCRPKVSNRIPVTLIDNGHCFLDGDDPIGARPDTLRIQKKSPPYTITEDEVDHQRNFLSYLLGGFRFDLRLASNRRYIEIATNTANTYARICSIYSTNMKFELSDEKENGQRLSFEQRLTRSRRLKEERPRDGDGSKPIRMFLLATVISCAALFIRKRFDFFTS